MKRLLKLDVYDLLTIIITYVCLTIGGCNAYAQMTDYQIDKFLRTELLKREMVEMALYAHRNSLGTPIFKNPNEECEYCYPAIEVEGFCVCRNPLGNYMLKPKGSFVLSCPDGSCKFVTGLNQEDCEIIDMFLDINKDGSGWMVIDHETICDLIDEMSIEDTEYLIWMWRLFGWQEYNDKEGYVETPEGGIILTREIIE